MRESIWGKRLDWVPLPKCINIYIYVYFYGITSNYIKELQMKTLKKKEVRVRSGERSVPLIPTQFCHENWIQTLKRGVSGSIRKFSSLSKPLKFPSDNRLSLLPRQSFKENKRLLFPTVCLKCSSFISILPNANDQIIPFYLTSGSFYYKG